jgi:hypothetical protein
VSCGDFTIMQPTGRPNDSCAWSDASRVPTAGIRPRAIRRLWVGAWTRAKRFSVKQTLSHHAKREQNGHKRKHNQTQHTAQLSRAHAARAFFESPATKPPFTVTAVWSGPRTFHDIQCDAFLCGDSRAWPRHARAACTEQHRARMQRRPSKWRMQRRPSKWTATMLSA